MRLTASSLLRAARNSGSEVERRESWLPESSCGDVMKGKLAQSDTGRQTTRAWHPAWRPVALSPSVRSFAVAEPRRQLENCVLRIPRHAPRSNLGLGPAVLSARRVRGSAASCLPRARRSARSTESSDRVSGTRARSTRRRRWPGAGWEEQCPEYSPWLNDGEGGTWHRPHGVPCGGRPQGPCSPARGPRGACRRLYSPTSW